MTTVYLIRHSMKLRGPVNGAFPVFDRMQPLSAEGEERARRLLEFPELRGADFAVASTMSRSLATIRYLIEADDVPYAIDRRLNELEFGKKPEDMPMDEFMGRRWRFPDEVPEEGESVTACRNRMEAAILETVREHPGEKILIGSHGAAIGAYLSGVLGSMEDDFVRSINLPDVFRLGFDGDRAVAFDRLDMPFPIPRRGESARWRLEKGPVPS